jgi:hypothetical protein
MKLPLKINALWGTTFLLLGCQGKIHHGPVIWVGNADLSEYNEVVADFANAFASDPLCHGIRLETTTDPGKPYWFLEIYSAAELFGGPHDSSGGISWWMNRDTGGEIVKFEGSDSSSSKAAHHVCFIIQGKGGDVH